MRRGAAERLRAAELTFARQVAGRDGQWLQGASEEHRADEGVVRAAVMRDGLALQFASPALRAARDVVLAAVRSNGDALRFALGSALGSEEVLAAASTACKACVELMTAAVRSNPAALAHAPAAVRGDESVVLGAVSRSGLVLEHASEALRADTRTVLAAVRQDGRALRWAAASVLAGWERLVDEEPSLAEDWGFMLEAVAADAAAMGLAAPLLLGDRDFVLEAVRRRGAALALAPTELRADLDVVAAAMRQDLAAFRHAAAPVRMHVQARGRYPAGFVEDRECMLEAVRANGLWLEYASEELRGDAELVGEAVRNNGSALRFAAAELQSSRPLLAAASKKLRGDRIFVLGLVGEDGLLLEFAVPALKSSKEVALAAVGQNPQALAHVGADLLRKVSFATAAVGRDGMLLAALGNEHRASPSVIAAAVRQNPLALRHAAEELVAVRDWPAAPTPASEEGVRAWLLAAVGRDGRALEYLPDNLRADRDVVIAAVAQHGAALEHGADALRRDHSVVIAAVKQTGSALEHAADVLRRDRSVVLAAVTQDGSALRFADPALKSDPVIAQAAARQDHRALQYVAEELQAATAAELDLDMEGPALEAVAASAAGILAASKRLRGNRNFVLRALAMRDQALRNCPAKSRAEREVMRAAAMCQEAHALLYVSDALRADRDVVMAAVTQHGTALEHAADVLRRDRSVVLAAVTQDGSALRFAPALKSDPIIARAAARQDHRALQYVAEGLQAATAAELNLDMEGPALEAVAASAAGILAASKRLRGNRSFVLRALAIRGLALRYCPENLRADREVVRLAVHQDGRALAHANAILLGDDRELLQLALLGLDEDGRRELLKLAVAVCGGRVLRFDASNMWLAFRAVQCDGLALQHAAPPLRAKPRLVAAAILRDTAALWFADPAALLSGTVVDAVGGGRGAVSASYCSLLFFKELRRRVKCAVNLEGKPTLKFLDRSLQLDSDLLGKRIAAGGFRAGNLMGLLLPLAKFVQAAAEEAAAGMPRVVMAQELIEVGRQMDLAPDGSARARALLLGLENIQKQIVSLRHSAERIRSEP